MAALDEGNIVVQGILGGAGRPRKAAITAVIAAGLILSGASVAYAEGTRTDSVSAWGVGHDSGPWSDGNFDSASTTVKLQGSVSIAQAGSPFSYTPSSVQLQLQRDVFGVGWQSQGNRTAAPGSLHNWGDVTAGSYRFQYNGATQGGVFRGAGSGFALFASSGGKINW